jgi:medium-chain acyl-[acyl-carrier-protein] hydrolase
MESKIYQPVLSEKFQVRSYDIGLNRRMRISSLCSYFQEVAGKHATHLDVGYRFVQQTGMVWVLSKLFVQINKLPEWGEEFNLETWPLGNERIFYRRDYRIRNEMDTLIAATSYWILLDITSRRPKIIPLNEGVLKANKGNFSMQMPAEGIPAVKSAETFIHQVQYSDLDQNRHVNNARYVEWVFDTIDQDVIENKAPVSFAIEYKQEVRSGDYVLLKKDRIEGEQTTFITEGSLSESGQVCFRSKVIFQ